MVKDYIAHLVDAQRAVITTANLGLPRLLPEGKKIEGGQANHRHLGRLQDRRLGTVWMARLGSSLALGKTRPKKLQPCWRGPFQVVKTDAKRQTGALLDPTDLKVASPDVHITVLTKYRKGLTSSDDLLEHDMYYELTKGIKLNTARS